MFTRGCVYICTGSYIYKQVCVCIYIYMYMYTCICIYLYIYIRTHVHIHTRRPFGVYWVRFYGHHRTGTEKKMRRPGGRAARRAEKPIPHHNGAKTQDGTFHNQNKMTNDVGHEERPMIMSEIICFCLILYPFGCGRCRLGAGGCLVVVEGAVWLWKVPSGCGRDASRGSRGGPWGIAGRSCGSLGVPGDPWAGSLWAGLGGLWGILGEHRKTLNFQGSQDGRGGFPCCVMPPQDPPGLLGAPLHPR